MESSHCERVSVVVVASAGVNTESSRNLAGPAANGDQTAGALVLVAARHLGSSILGSGEVALILDVNSLGELVTAESGPPGLSSVLRRFTKLLVRKENMKPCLRC